MERALFCTGDLNEFPAGYERLYVGSEFCPWTFPFPERLRSLCTAARGAGYPLTLVTPVCSEDFLPRLRRTLDLLLPDFAAVDEVVISDWGALALVREIAPSVPVVLGRVLSGQKRDPRILTLDLSDEQLHYFRQGSWYTAAAREVLAEQGIVRVELDNLPQGLAPLSPPLVGSLHTPWAMVASSRNCPYREPGTVTCAAPCGEVFTLSSPQSPLPLYQGGNTQFVRLDTLPDNLAALGIDRIVEHRRLPR